MSGTTLFSKAHKIRIFEACVRSKMLYCLHTAWLNKAELRSFNAFLAKCFRKIFNIPHSFVSRTSNKIVLERSGRQEISSILTYRQISPNYADPSLDRHRRLIGMRPGTRFFIYGTNGLEVLLQMPTSTHGLTSLAKNTGIWQNMLPVCLSIGGFNVCSPGILLALDVWAVHETPGIQNLMRTADMRILDIGEMRHWTTPYGTHILIRL